MVTSGLSIETIVAARFRSIPVAESHKVGSRLGWSRPPGIAFGDWLGIPYYAIDGTFTGFVRFKADTPRNGRDGRPVKYESPIRTSPRVYFPPNQNREVYSDPSIPLIIVEGEKKCLALVQHGFPAIGIGGVWSWQKKRIDESKPRELIDDFHQITWAGRPTIILFDSDLATNEKVEWAAFYLSETMKLLGAVVVAARIPPGERGAKAGADDLLLHGGPDLLRDLIRVALPLTRPQKLEPSYERTDLGNGRRLAAFAEDLIRFTFDRDVWLVFDGQRWNVDAKSVLVEAVAKKMLRQWTSQAIDRHTAAMRALAKCTDKAESEALKAEEEDAKAEFSFAMKSQERVRMRAAIAMARTEYPILVPKFAETFDTDEWLLNCANGTVDLTTGECREFNHADFLTKLTPVKFNTSAEAPLYHRFLNAVFAHQRDVIDFIRRLSGLAITGDVTDQALNIGWGQGANGKTTLLELWLAVVGEYGGKVPEELLISDKSGSRHPCEKVVLQGLRLAVASESSQDGRLDEARVKALTGGDTITARGMRENFFTFPPHYTLILLTNHKPRVVGTDHGIWRRLRLLEFNQRFWTEADRKSDPKGTFDPNQKADPAILEKLKAESEGILRDMVDQAVAHFQGGRTLSVPATVLAATKVYRESEDLLGEFFSTRVRPDRNKDAKPSSRKRLKGSELYKAYKSWAEENGFESKGSNRMLGTKAFGNEARQRLDWHNSNGVHYFAELIDVTNGCDADHEPDGPEGVDDVSESWRDGDFIPSEAKISNSPSMGVHPESTHQVSNSPFSDSYVFQNSEAGGIW